MRQCCRVLISCFFALVCLLQTGCAHSAYYILEDPKLRDAFELAVVSITGKNFKQEQDLRMSNFGMGGMSEVRKVLVQLDGKKYVMRIFPPGDLQKTQSEIKAHNYAASLGVSPDIIYVDPSLQFIMTSFVEGHNLKYEDLQNNEIVRKIAKNIKAIQKYQGELPLYRPQVWRTKKHYLGIQKRDIVVPSVYSDLYQKYYSEGVKLNSNKENLVLSHGDLNKSNIMITDDNEVYMIDWSEATFDNKYADLGYFSFLNGLTAAQNEAFLSAYLENDSDPEALYLFAKFQCRTSFITATVWFDYSYDGLDNKTPISQRLDKLNQLFNDPNLKTGYEYIDTRDFVPLNSNPSAILLYGLGFLKTYMLCG